MAKNKWVESVLAVRDGLLRAALHILYAGDLLHHVSHGRHF